MADSGLLIENEAPFPHFCTPEELSEPYDY